mmetsp:Transcript_17224/g.25315  ORF Transcript_17224/g.25315 Transcript_17224/m.25315 type:complete len:96 (+) Transcript_17224:580-867(+)
MYMYMTVYTCICHVLPLRFGLGGRSGEKRSRKQRDKLRHSFPPEVQKDSQYGAWDGNVARLPCCKFDPSHRVALRKLKEHEARCPANPARLSKQS